MPDRKILGEATARLNIDTSDIAKNLTDALQGAQKTADKNPIIVSVDLKNKTIGSIKSGLYTYKKIFNETSKLQADIDKKKQQGYDKTAVANYIEEYLWNAWGKFNVRKDKTHIEHQGDFIAAVQAAKALGFSNFQDDNKPIKTKYESLKNSFGYIPLKNIKDSESHLNLIESSLNEIESRLQVINDSIEKNAYYSAKTFIDEEQKKQNKIKQTTDVISEELKKQKLLGETIRLSTKNNLERFKVDLPSELFQEELSYGSSDKNLMIEFVGSGDNSGFSRELANKVYDAAQTKISDIDTSVHTHPENYIATPSYDDLEQFANLASDGVKKHIVAALGEVTTIDLSEIFKDDNYEISDKYYDAVKEYEDWYNDVFISENFSKEDNANLKNIETRLKSLYDYNGDDARLQFDTDNVFMRNKLMSIFEKYGLSNIIKTTKMSNVYDNDNFEQIKNNASSIFTGLLPLTKEDRQSFISLQDNINSLSDIKVNTDSIDKLKTSADSVTESLKEINSAFDSNTLSNGLSEINGDLKSIETQAKETENAVDNISQPAFVSNDEAFKNDVEQTQVSLKTSKEAVEELLEERRRSLN